MDALKNKIIAILTAIAGVLGLLFLWEQRKANVNEALVTNTEINAETQKLETQIATNDQILKSEEVNRATIESTPVNEDTTPQNVIDFFRNRKP